jgi:mannose-1-phosphate guanylyltransferase/phosphomannomutase
VVDHVDADSIRARHPKMVVDYGGGSTALTGPLVLGRIGSSVLAVNAVVDPDRVVLSERELEGHLEGLGRLVRSSGAELGALMDSPGERLRLVDGSGRVLDPSAALLAYVRLMASVIPTPRLALPVTTSRVAGEIVAGAGGEVIWTPISTGALMAAADRGGISFAGDEDGGYAFPEFLTAFDAVMSLAKLLELLARTGMSLAEVVDDLPAAHIAREEVHTPWEAKGAVMRRLIEHVDGNRVVTIDGVKAYRGEDWILVIPHPQEPLVRVWAEAGSAESAEALVSEFANLVEALRA